MNVLHINRNYMGNHVHRTMIKNFEKHNDINNKIFVPECIYYNEKLSKNVTVSKCFNKIDGLFFRHKSKKIQKCILTKYDFEKIDIIHAYTLFTDGNIAYFLKKKYNIPYIVAIRDTDVVGFFKYRPYLRKIGIEIMENADAIIFMSKTYKDFMFNKYFKKNLQKNLEHKVHIIPNGLGNFWQDNINSNKNKKLDDTINIISVGDICKRKNILTTQKAIEILRKQGYKIKFTIIGKIVNYKIYKKLIKYPNTFYYGKMNKEKLINFYRNNDILVMPSYNETFGMVYIEAISQGLPVIYTEKQGFDGQFKDGVVGYSVNPKNPNDISNAIKKIINNYNKLSNNCLDNCNNFNWEIILKKYIKLYSNIIKKKKE